MNRTIIIAEAGVNHNGDINIAKKLIDEAAKVKVDYVKFQTFITENLVARTAPKSKYQYLNELDTESQYDMLKRLELSREDHINLIQYCKKKGIRFISTPFDMDSIDLLADLKMTIYKIGSGELTNFPYLKKIGRLQKKLILSTGMASMNEIRDALNILVESGTEKSKITILHTNTDYPTPYCDVNLRAMVTIRDTFGVKVGYSDHTLGILVPIAAVALGASIIEKHFTLSRNMKGPDHKASIEPNELRDLVDAIRTVEIAMGSDKKNPSSSEIMNLHYARKSIHAKLTIDKGAVFSEDNICVKRPGNGISPMNWMKIIGKRAIRNYNEGDMLDKNEIL